MSEMITAMCADGGWYDAVFAAVLLIALLLAVAALLKYLLARAY